MRIVAAIDNSAAAGPVVEAARAIGGLYRAEVQAVHVRENGTAMAAAAATATGIPLHTETGRPVERLSQAMQAADVAALVIGARSTPAGRRPAGSTALRLITSVPKPVVVVPPDVKEPATVDSILVPLDGSPESAAGVSGTIELARGRGIEVLVVHVREEDALPSFSDQLHHEARAWAEEFVARYCPCPLEEIDLHLRVGVPREEVSSVVRETGADLVALGWSQDLGRGRAAVVRDALSRSPVPILLLPLPG